MTAPTNQHYDQDPRLFRCFLDRTMKYSSGLYLEADDDLEHAQQHKLAFIAASLGAAPGKRFLDVGCGWGSLMLYLAETHGCFVVGVTPAPAQADYIASEAAARGLGERVEVVTSMFEHLRLDPASFDGASFVGSSAHFPDFAAALVETHRVVRRGGRVYWSDSCYRNAAKLAAFAPRPSSRFVVEEIFGAGVMSPLSYYVRAFEDAGFSLTGMRDLTRDYERTIAAWRERLDRSRATVETLVAGGVARYTRYFDIANAAWGYATKHYALIAARQR